MMVILKMPHTVQIYDHSRCIPANGVNYQGSLYDFPFAPKEKLQTTYWRESFNEDLYSMAHARRQNLIALVQLLGDTITVAAFC